MKQAVTCGSVRFVDLPEWFLERYSDEINAWARNLRKIGLVKAFILREGHLSEITENGYALIQVKLKCQPWRGGVEISPLEERDEVLIDAHVKKMQAAKIPSNVILAEPERPFMPFMPRIVQ